MLKIREQMGSFDFQAAIPEGIDQSRLELRPAVMLDEEVIYEG